MVNVTIDIDLPIIFPATALTSRVVYSVVNTDVSGTTEYDAGVDCLRRRAYFPAFHLNDETTELTILCDR